MTDVSETVQPVRAPQQLFDLTGRVVVVTGASSGLGARFARVLSAAGAEVVAVARREERLRELAAETERVTPVRCDVTDHDAVRRLVDRTVAEHGAIDVLINNAAVGGGRPDDADPIEHFRSTMESNLTSVYAVSQIVAPGMLERGSGSIINLASIFGLVGSAPLTQAAYCASKAGVVNLTRELACEWARRGVRVNAIAPAFFASDMTAEMWSDERSMAWIRRNTPQGRAGDVHELDGVVLLLASGASTYLTGQTIAVDGGWTAR